MTALDRIRLTAPLPNHGGIDGMKAYIDVSLVVLFWGVSFIATKYAVREFSPSLVALMRFLISYLFLGVITRWRRYPLRKDAILAGLWGITVYFFGENTGLKFTTPSNASIIVSTAPVITAVFLDTIRRRFRFMEYLASFVSFMGVAFVVYNGRVNLGINPLGDMLVMLAAFAWAVYTLHVSKVSRSENPLFTRQLTFWGCVFLIPLIVAEKLFYGQAFMVSPSAKGLISVIFLGLVASGLGYLLWNRAISVLGAKKVTNAIYLIPLVTVMADWVVFSNKPGFLLIAGAVLVILGLIMLFKYVREVGN